MRRWARIAVMRLGQVVKMSPAERARDPPDALVLPEPLSAVSMTGTSHPRPAVEIEGVSNVPVVNLPHGAGSGPGVGSRWIKCRSDPHPWPIEGWNVISSDRAGEGHRSKRVTGPLKASKSRVSCDA